MLAEDSHEGHDHSGEGEDSHDDHGGHVEGFPMPYTVMYGGFLLMLFLDQVIFKPALRQIDSSENVSLTRKNTND